MSDFPPTLPGGTALPPVHHLDPGSGSLPAKLEWAAAPPEPVVLLVDAARDRAWAADAAVALAAGWARAGRRVVLADLHLDDPVLHERVGVQNLDGIVDVFLYGASLARTARPIPGRGFYLISAGTYAAEPETVLRHSRWPRIAAGFSDAHATLLLFVPAGSPGLASLAGWAPPALVLGEPDPELRDRLPAGLQVRAVVAPPGATLAEDAALVGDVAPGGDALFVDEVVPEEEAAPPDDGYTLHEEDAGPDDYTLLEEEAPSETASDGTLVADEASGAGGPRVEVPPAVIPWTDPYEERADPLLGEYAAGIPASTLPPGAVKSRAVDLRDPPPAAPAERGREEVVVGPERRKWLRPVLLVVLGAVLFYAAGSLLLAANPGLLDGFLGTGGSGGEAAPAAATAERRAPAPAAAPAGEALPYSVQAKAFASLRAARQMVEGNSARLSGVPLYVSPEPVEGVVYYKVLAGMLRDTVEAAALRELLVEARVVEASDAQGAWSMMQFTPLAFDLGEVADRAAAQARSDSLLRAEVPSYAVAVPYADGSERWRVYGGAFRDSASAEGMRRILADRGIEARLVERVGAPAPAPR
ncbi:MAG TPA: hypothetical protein VGR37_07895 [Longimicrobiaceae bacterium]|nr:hypothetical protein [Longimicrobiaceae bacterium]